MASSGGHWVKGKFQPSASGGSEPGRNLGDTVTFYSNQKVAGGRLMANAADLAADYKHRGFDQQRSWSEFVKDRDLTPEMNAKDFYKVYNSVTALPLSASRGDAASVTGPLARMEYLEGSKVTYAKDVIVTGRGKNDSGGTYIQWIDRNGHTGTDQTGGEFSYARLVEKKGK